ncbi:MAG TPA: tripartite tricarboxylate transporter substrate binding protein [Burkholderiales bacterium]|jgi:tripartite-type tricarboxylate transporter receptor subunit TctC
MNTTPRLLCLVAAALSLAAAAVQAVAQNYPVKPVRIVIPFPPGSGADILARSVAAKLTERSGQQVLVDPRPGGSGIVAADIVLKAPADGYTLMVGTSSTHAISLSVRRNLPYHPVRDFMPISKIAVVPMMVTVHPSLPVKSAKELIAFARARPGQINFATAGVGTTGHLAGELFKSMARVDIVHVAYRGSPQALVETVAGQVSMAISPILTVLPHVRAGRLRALAVTTPQSSPTAPDVPPLAVAAGLPGYEATLWYGLFAPAGTPRAIVNRLSSEVVAILQLNDVGETLRKQGAQPEGMTPDQFAAYQQSEIAKWAKVVKESGVTVN